ESCVTTDSDPKNCGGCGTVCEGQCALGRCLVTLATGQSAPRSIAVDGTNVYWITASGTSVYSIPLNGGTPKLVASGPSSQYGIGLALDATNVFFTGVGTGVLTVPKGGGTATTIPGGLGGDLLRVDSNYIYFPCASYLPVGGGVQTNVAYDHCQAATVDDYNFYWIEGSYKYGNGSVLSVPIAGGQTVTAAIHQYAAYDIAVDSTSIYVANATVPGTVMKMP